MIRRIELIIWTATITLLGAWLIGQVFRDYFWLTGLCFYLPSPMVVCVLAGVGCLAWWWSRRRIAAILATLAVIPALFVVGVENQWRAPSGQYEHLQRRRIVCWNIGGAAFGLDDVRRALQETQADLYILAECPRNMPLATLPAELGADDALPFLNMTVAARGQVISQEQVVQGTARAWLFRWKHQDASVKVLAIDLPSSIAIHRDPVLQWANGLIVQHKPDIVVGDFNAPRRSRALTNLPGGYAHAYELAGAGWSYSWPVPVPLWAIDQCIVASTLTALRYELRTAMASDHRMQVLDFAPRMEEPAVTRR